MADRSRARRSRTPARALLASAAGFAVAAALGLGAAGGQASQPYDEGEPERRPDVLIVMTDDQPVAAATRRVMPRTHRALRRQGTFFTEAIASPPICCPARAGLLTGQYAHNHGVVANFYNLLEDAENVLPAWHAEAGYRTAFFGKFMNNYIAAEGDVPAPGWDRWLKLTHPGEGYREVRAHYDYEAVDQTVRRAFGARPGDYSSRMIGREALDFVGSLKEDEPFLAWVSHWAPHEASDPSRACPGYSPKPPSDAAVRRFRGERAPRGPAFNHTTRSMPPHLRRTPPLTPQQLRGVDRRWRCLLAASRAIDQANHTLFEGLKQLGRWQNTLVVFVSDNGLPWGERRQLRGKAELIGPVVEVPLMMKFPGPKPAAVRRSDVHVSTVDIAPTITSVTKAQPCVIRGPTRVCRRIDGRSLVPLANGRTPFWAADRAIPISMRQRCGAYDAIRTPRWSYLVSRAEPRCRRADELYDLRRDPHQLRNLAGNEQASRAERTLSRRFRSVIRCSGAIGRSNAIEGRTLCE